MQELKMKCTLKMEIRTLKGISKLREKGSINHIVSNGMAFKIVTRCTRNTDLIDANGTLLLFNSSALLFFPG